MRKLIAAVLCGALFAATLCGCSGSDVTVTVQSVADLVGYGSVGLYDSYGGVVEAGETVDLEKDMTMEVSEIFVKAGEDVTEGQLLFSYDIAELTLERDKKTLELEQAKSEILTKRDQIEDLKKEKQYASSSAQIDYTLQIQSLEIEVQEMELGLSVKEKEIARFDALLENAEVVSPVTGTVQTVNTTGATDDYGNPKPFISLTQSGAFRIKGLINEQQAYALREGMEVTVCSRVDETTWHGVIALVDFSHPISDGGGMYYPMPEDGMTASSKYPFYITLDSDEGLLLGQHVYIAPYMPDGDDTGLALPAAYVVDEGYVWAEKKGELEKRRVKLGEYDEATDTYPILSGLSVEDYIAFPDETCAEGVSTSRYDPNAPIEEGGNDIGNIGGMDEGFEGGFEEGFEESFEGGFEEGGVMDGGFAEDVDYGTVDDGLVVVVSEGMEGEG